MVEVWLTKKNIAIRCMVVKEDESTETVILQTTNIRGAMRHVTKVLGAPVGRWKKEAVNEYSRVFR